MTVKQLFRSVTALECVQPLIELHRKYYYEPGHIFKSSTVRDRYNTLYNSITESCTTASDNNIQFQYDKKQRVYNILYNNKLMKDCELPIDMLASARVHKPELLDKNQAAMEILYEYTYYTL